MIAKGLLGLGGALLALCVTPAQAQNFVGQILISGTGGCPDGTRLANGDLLPIQKERPATGDDFLPLFAVYGTAYGGDGKTNFALPDLGAQVIAFNNIGRGAMDRPKVPVDAPPAMRAELPIVFCVVLRAAPPPKAGK